MPPVLPGNPHLHTVCPAVFRRVKTLCHRRRINTPVGDSIRPGQTNDAIRQCFLAVMDLGRALVL